MALNILLWLGLLVGLVALVVWLVRQAAYPRQALAGSAGPLTAREIAQMRYARGEISREEYLKLKDDLQ